MPADLRQLLDFLLEMGIETVPHTQRNYLAHLVAVYRLMQSRGECEDLCRAGMFHSIYGTEKFQGFKLPLSDRDQVVDLIGARAERLAFWNCLMDRASLDAQVERSGTDYELTNRETGEPMRLNRQEFDDLCRVHLYDWLEQVPRSRFGWDYRRAAYRGMADRLGGQALATYLDVFAGEPAQERPN